MENLQIKNFETKFNIKKSRFIKKIIIEYLKIYETRHQYK